MVAKQYAAAVSVAVYCFLICIAGIIILTMPKYRLTVPRFLTSRLVRDKLYGMTVVQRSLKPIMDISYISGNEELLDSIEPLWVELNKLHLEKSQYFKSLYTRNTFEARKKALLSAARKGHMLVVLACDKDLSVGYCVASLVEGIGEIDSLFVAENYRKQGIAKRLMNEALQWLETFNPVKIIVKVSVGNEDVFGFYARYGLLPRLAELQRV